jgi:hypothetical protein
LILVNLVSGGNLIRTRSDIRIMSGFHCSLLDQEFAYVDWLRRWNCQ